jgi:murein peptide amidase A
MWLGGLGSRSAVWPCAAIVALGNVVPAQAWTPSPDADAVVASVPSPPAKAFVARSAQGRELRALHVGSERGPAILIVGAIHGDESAGIAVARDLLADGRHERSNLWVVSDLNPDGVARGTRQNARGVDLNRNFPWRWQAAGQLGDLEFPGPRVLSEPESRFAYSLIRRIRPVITVWFHQPFGVVDASGGSRSVEQRFARRVGLPLQRLPRYRGSVASWQNHRFRSATAFVVELPPGSLDDAGVERYAHAVEAAAQ